MVNRSKQKGTAAESAVVQFLQRNGWRNVERRALAGSTDKGDIAGVQDTVIEVKDCAKLELSAWLNEAETERVNAGAYYGFVWAKRRGKSDPGDWYVVMDGDTLIRLLEEAGVR